MHAEIFQKQADPFSSSSLDDRVDISTSADDGATLPWHCLQLLMMCTSCVPMPPLIDRQVALHEPRLPSE